MKISSALSRSAGDYAKRALESYVEPDLADFVLFGGIAIELALKAKLARANPLFIAALDSFKSWLDIHRSGDDISLLTARTKTVGASEAISRLGQLQPDLRDLITPAQELIALRNAQAHLGQIDSTQKRRIVVVFLRTIEALLQVDPDEFWNPHAELVRTLLDHDSAETDRVVRERMAAARVTFNIRVESLSGEQQSALHSITEGRLMAKVDGTDSLLISCPVCDWPAEAEGTTEHTDWDVDFDKEGNPENAWPVLTFFVSSIRCEACGLILEGEHEIQAAGLEPSFRNEEIDIDAWVRDNFYEDSDF